MASKLEGMLTSELLMQAQGLIGTPATWCRGERARDETGAAIDVLSPAAVQFCSKGALLCVAAGDATAIADAEKLLNKSNPYKSHYVGMNERHSHEAVMAMWAKAIETARYEEDLARQGLTPFDVQFRAVFGVR